MAMLDRNDFGADVAPSEGFYKIKLRKDGAWVPVRVYYEDGEQGEDGEFLSDAVLRCDVAGSLVDPEKLWPTLKQSTSAKITNAEWVQMMLAPPPDVNISQFQRREPMEVTSNNGTGPTQSESIAALAKALADAQGKIKGAAKDSDNPFFKSKYADLASVWEACRKQLSDAGLAVIQTTANGVDAVTVITTLAHSSGEWIRGSLTLRPVKADPQGAVAAITYARRAALAAMVGVAPEAEDDDGEAASGRDTKTTKKAAPKPLGPTGITGVTGIPGAADEIITAICGFDDSARLKTWATSAETTARVKALPNAENARALQAYRDRMAILGGVAT